MLAKTARARARIRARVRTLTEAAGGFPWLETAGKTLTGWLFTDMDGTLVTARSGKEGAAPAWKKGSGFHPLAAWCVNTRECPDMPLRPGNAGPGTFEDHKEVPGRALRQVPGRFRRKVIVRADGAGASHELVKYLLGRSPARKTPLFTRGWMITGSGEAAVTAVPEDARKPGVRQDGAIEEDKDAAGITGLMSRFIDVPHRDHATVETDGVRTAKAMGLRDLPSKTWQVNKGWVLAANTAAGLTSRARLLGLHDQEELRDAEPDTLRHRIWHIPARLVRHARKPVPPGHAGQYRTPPARTKTDMNIKNRHQCGQ